MLDNINDIGNVSSRNSAVSARHWSWARRTNREWSPRARVSLRSLVRAMRGRNKARRGA
jgi:hypothetical protein